VVEACVTPWPLRGDLPDPEAALTTAKASINADLEQKLDRTYAAVLAAAPYATVYVVGYPPVVEADDPGKWPLGVRAANVQAAADLINDLNKVQTRVISQIGTNHPDHPDWPSRIVFVDPGDDNSPFTGHSVHDDDSFYATVWDALSGKGSASPYAFHPNLAGNQAYAQVVGQAMLTR
jgi:hypothetical protein